MTPRPDRGKVLIYRPFLPLGWQYGLHFKLDGRDLPARLRVRTWYGTEVTPGLHRLSVGEAEDRVLGLPESLSLFVRPGTTLYIECALYLVNAHTVGPFTAGRLVCELVLVPAEVACQRIVGLRRAGP